MSNEYSSILGLNKRRDADTKSAIDEYNELFRGEGEQERRETNYMKMVNNYYDVVTDFYEWGWGQSFHFAPRYKGESFQESLRRHELRLAAALETQPGMKLLDVGCGVGGPMRTIARFTRCHVTGLNNNAYQIRRGQLHNQSEGLDRLCNFIQADFMKMPVPDNSYDGVYAMEATCHAPDRVPLFKEILRVLKPGGVFAVMEWCMTEKFDPENANHVQIKHDILEGDSLPDLPSRPAEIDAALRKAGFEVEWTLDYATVVDGEAVPWYAYLAGDAGMFTLAGFRASAIGRKVTSLMVGTLETLRLAPKGSLATQNMLCTGADGLVKGGQLEIFTPMYFCKARKPAV